eukprot:2671454-Pleurochrysis_carterae.AAC.5
MLLTRLHVYFVGVGVRPREFRAQEHLVSIPTLSRAFGGRLDHMMANMNMVCRCLASPRTRLTLVASSRRRLRLALLCKFLGWCRTSSQQRGSRATTLRVRRVYTDSAATCGACLALAGVPAEARSSLARAAPQSERAEAISLWCVRDACRLLGFSKTSPHG